MSLSRRTPQIVTFIKTKMENMGLPGLGKVGVQIYNNVRDEQGSILNKPRFPTQQKTVYRTKIFSVKMIFFFASKIEKKIELSTS